MYAKNKEINPVNPNQLVGRGRRKKMENIENACDLCIYRLCFEWAGLKKENRKEVFLFLQFLQKLRTISDNLPKI